MCSGYLLTSPSKLSTNPCHPCRLSTFAPIGLHFAILALAHFFSSKIEDMDPKERCRTDDQHDDSSYTEGSCILQSYLLDNSPLHMTSRTALQTLQYVICSDCFWQRLDVLLLFIGTATVFDKSDTDCLYHRRFNRWFAVYESACGVLRFEIATVFAVYLAR